MEDVSREELRLASRLFALPLRRGPRGAARRAATWPRCSGSLPHSKKNPPPSSRAAGDSRARALADAARERSRRRPAALRRILKPTRPLPLAEISSLLGLDGGPAIWGSALDAFDLALAVRGDPRPARGPGLASAPVGGFRARGCRLLT